MSMTQVGSVLLELRRRGRLTAEASLNLDFFHDSLYSLSLSLAESTSYSVSLRGMVMSLRPFRAHPVPSMAFTRRLRATLKRVRRAAHLLHCSHPHPRVQS